MQYAFVRTFTDIQIYLRVIRLKASIAGHMLDENLLILLKEQNAKSGIIALDCCAH